jgi:hypothetical protein
MATNRMTRALWGSETPKTLISSVTRLVSPTEPAYSSCAADSRLESRWASAVAGLSATNNSDAAPNTAKAAIGLSTNADSTRIRKVAKATISCVACDAPALACWIWLVIISWK